MAIACAAWAGIALSAAAQPPILTVPHHGSNPVSSSSFVNAPLGVMEAPAFDMPLAQPPISAAGPSQIRPPQVPAPLARVIKNPDVSTGMPPYALTDNSGAIQRYVEPVPGVDLESYLGEVVRVRHDTGRTLLASQLELPPQPLHPLIGESASGSPREFSTEAARPIRVATRTAAKTRHTEYADRDDTTVQLLAVVEEEDLPNGDPAAEPENAEPSASTDAETSSPSSETGSPSFPYGMPAEMGPFHGASLPGQPMHGESMEMGYPQLGMPGAGMEMGGAMEACPGCGQYHASPGYGAPFGQNCGPMGCQPAPQRSRFFAEVELNFLRAHIMENFAGKLSEKYELSPRVIVGFDGNGHIDARARYWHYGRETQILGGGGGIRVEFDVVDLEATRGFQAGKSEIVIGAGLRAARIELTDDDNDTAGNDLLGMTLAADLETPVCRYRQGQFYGLCGARLSLLGGDWGQNGGSDFVPSQLQDDNVVVQELYAGVGYAFCYRDYNLYSRLAFEMQNWHSDALSQFAGADSIGFLGPGLEIGAQF